MTQRAFIKIPGQIFVAVDPTWRVEITKNGLIWLYVIAAHDRNEITIKLPNQECLDRLEWIINDERICIRQYEEDGVNYTSLTSKGNTGVFQETQLPS